MSERKEEIITLVHVPRIINDVSAHKKFNDL